MMNGKKLIEVGEAEPRWAEDATGVVYEDWDVDRIIEAEAANLRNKVLQGSMSIDELRAVVSWTNALDKEAVEAYGTDLSRGDQQVERVARRTMHLASRATLDDLKSNRKRFIARASCKHVQNLVQ